MRRLKTRLRGAGGFTLAELMLSILILLLATALLADTIRVATRQFFRSRQETGAQLLCSSLATFLEDELTFAEVTGGGGGTLPAIRSSAHRLGGGVRFGILPTGGGSASYTLDSASRGYIVATSDAYASLAEPYYLPVGRTAYRTSGNSAYDLKAGLAMTWEDGRFHVTVSIYDADAAAGDPPLTESSFSVKPLSGS